MRYRYRSEEELKDSGVDWLGKIPKDWEVKRNKNIFSISKKLVGDKADEYKVLSLTLRGVIERDIESNTGKLPASFATYQIVKPDSILLCLFDMDVTPRICGYINQQGIVTSAYTNINSHKDVFNKYFYYWFLRMDFEKILLSQSKSLRNTLTNENFMNITIAQPKYKEQEKIANFLDEKTSQFDLIISKKEKLIERLEEAKKSLISEVVTGKVKIVKTDDGYELVKRSSKDMKDSGVEWIGCIPIDFKTVRLGLVSFVTKLAGFEYTDYMANKLSDTGEVPIVRAGNIKMNRFIDQEKEFIDMETSKKLNRCALYQKCVLMTFIGAGIGEVALFDKNQRHHLAPNVAKIEILGENKKKIDEEYLVYYLMSSSGQEEVNKIKKASAQPSLSMETIRSMKIVIPELNEQYEINKYLSMKIKEIDKITNKTKLQIEKLKEAKQSLISEAVTGKIEILD